MLDLPRQYTRVRHHYTD